MPGVVGDEKIALRRQVRAARAAMPPAARAQEAAATALSLQAWLGSRPVSMLAGYAAHGDELSIDDVLAWAIRQGIPSVLPRVSAPRVLTFHLINSLSDLIPGHHGIREPDPATHPAIALEAGSVILVPGTAFTATGLRLGQGGGFYDALLGPQFLAIGIAHSAQLVGAIPSEPHDRPVDAVMVAGRWLLPPPGERPTLTDAHAS